MNDSGRSLLDSTRKLLDTALGLLQTRVELLATEIEEEKARQRGGGKALAETYADQASEDIWDSADDMAPEDYEEFEHGRHLFVLIERDAALGSKCQPHLRSWCKSNGSLA